ncbi:MAG TPA: ABC transporter permease [Bacteroidia bacterium]|nr:ABC transporter permease [Bacteroidia bacterium]
MGPIRQFFNETGELARFFGKFWREAVLPPYEFKEVFRHLYFIGVSTLPLVSITSLIMGLVLTLQSRPTMVEFGAESFLPSMVSISIVREIGPVITALICAGKVGSGIGAELAGMRVTEQIDAMEVAGNNPFNYLVVTRTVACTYAVPILVVYADFLAMIGGYLGVNINSKVTFMLYFTKAMGAIDFSDLFPALIKTFFFGFFIALVSCYKGYNASNGTEGVGRAANASVVAASLMVFVVDMLAVQIADFITKLG